MSLNYDFDIFQTMPQEVLDEFEAEIRELGENPAKFAESKLALFRDSKTVAALEDADPRILSCLQNAGFGLNVFHSGAPDGHYPEEDQTYRNKIIEKLASNIEATDFRGMRQSEFDLPEFLKAIEAARPISVRKRKTRRRRRVPKRQSRSIWQILGLSGSRLQRVQKKLQRVKEMPKVSFLQDMPFSRLFQVIHPIVFAAYGKDMNRCLKAYSKQSNAAAHFHPDMTGNLFIVVTHPQFPVAYHQRIASRIDTIVNDKSLPQAQKGKAIWHLLIEDTPESLTQKIWNGNALVMPYPRPDKSN